MKLDQVVSVYCTDLEKHTDATIVRLERNSVTVDLKGILLKFYLTKPNLYIANHSGMEFVLRT